MAGSTAEVARAVGEEIARGGLQVDVLPLADVKDLESYDGVVVGAALHILFSDTDPGTKR
jgi:menaquinone-dependent protoporphyrinogen IX oxidase